MVRQEIFGIDLGPVDLARIAGHSNYKESGELWYPELQILHIIRCLRRSSPDDAPEIRLRRHLLLVGEKGTGKSTMSKLFLRRLCGAVPYHKVERGDRSKPTYVSVDGTGVSWEKLRGGVSEGNLVFPTLHEVDYLYSGEFKSFMGEGDSMRRRMETLNSALEEGDVLLSQLSMANVRKAQRDAFRKLCDDSGGRVEYNEEKDTVAYNIYAFFLGCTRELPKKTQAAMEDSGLMSRMHRSALEMSEEESERYMKNRFGPRNKWAEQELLKFNQYAWSATVLKVPPPSFEAVAEIVDFYFHEYVRVSRETGVQLSRLANERDNADAIQLIIAFSAMRHIEERMLKGEVAPVIETLEYLPQDLAAVKAFRRRHLSQVETKAMGEAKVDEARDKASLGLSCYLKKLHSNGDDTTTVETSLLAHFFMDGCDGAVGLRPITKPAAYNRIWKLRNTGLLSKSKTTGFDMVSRAARDAAQVLTEDDFIDERRDDALHVDMEDHPAMSETLEARAMEWGA